MKHFYESYGCLGYELYFPMIAEKKYFPYHITEKKNRYTEMLIFKDLKDFEKFYENVEKDESAQNLVGMYVKVFGISDCCFKILKRH